MTAHIVVDVYLNAKSGSTGPSNDTVIFSYDLQSFIPENPAKPSKIHVARNGDIYIGDTAADNVSLTFALQTHSLQWSGKAFTVSLAPNTNQAAEDLLWIAMPGVKPTGRWNPADKQFDSFKHPPGKAESLEVSIRRDKIGVFKDQFPYSLAVNVTDSNGKVTTVRQDPQIRDRGVPGSNWYETFQQYPQLALSFLAGILLAYLALRIHRQRVARRALSRQEAIELANRQRQ